MLTGAIFVVAATAWLHAATIAVRHEEGAVHGFLVLRTSDGQVIADGDLVQRVRASRVTARVTFRFKDGSEQDETVVFTQDGRFLLVSDHLIQRGPSFPRPLDMTVDAARGIVTMRSVEDGKPSEQTRHLDLPADLANGLIPILLKNVDPDAPPESVPLVVATPDPIVIKLKIRAAGRDRFATTGRTRRATHFVLEPHIGGLKGLLAPLVGRQPPNNHVWMLDDEVPTFVRAEQQFYEGGPLWRIDVVAPVWDDDGRPGR